MGSFWTPPFSKVFLNFPTPLGLSLLLPQLSDQPNVNKKTCRANFQSSEQLTVITAPGKNENNSIFYYFSKFSRGYFKWESTIFPYFNTFSLETLF